MATVSLRVATDQLHRQRNPQTSISGSKYILVTSSGDGRSYRPTLHKSERKSRKSIKTTSKRHFSENLLSKKIKFSSQYILQRDKTYVHTQM